MSEHVSESLLGTPPANRPASPGGWIPATAPPPAASPPAAPNDWENLIGGKWALWVGSLSLFLALGLFLAHKWQSLPPAPPWARVAMGLAAGAACLVIGHVWRTRTQRWFSEGISGAGLALFYLSIWAAAQHFHLIPGTAAFLAMALTTALGVWLAVSCDAMSLSVLATLGGFLTPLLLRSGGNEAPSTALLSYVAVLNAGLLATSLFKRWRGVIGLSFVATLLLVGIWYFNSYTAGLRWPTLAFESIYFLEFLGTACFYSLAHQEETAHADLLLLFATTTVFAAAAWNLMAGLPTPLPVALPLSLTLCFALMSTATRTLAPRNTTLRECASGLALLALTIAVPIQLRQHWLGVGWSAEAGVLLLLAFQLRGALLRRAGQLVWVLSLFSLVPVVLAATPHPHLLFLNARALPLLVSVAMMAAVAARAHLDRAYSDEPFTDELAPWYAVYASLAGAWLLAQETYLALSWHFGWHTVSTEPVAGLVVACLLSAYALTLFLLGLHQRHAALFFSAVGIVVAATALSLVAGIAAPHQQWTPFWNLRWLSYLVVSCTLAAMAHATGRHRDAFAAEELELLRGLPFVIALFALTGLSTETWFAFEHWAQPGLGNWYTSAACGLAIVWAIYTTVVRAIGYAHDHRALTNLATYAGAAALAALAYGAYGSIGMHWAPLFNLRCGAFVAVLVMVGAGWASPARLTGGGNSSSAPVHWLLPTAIGLWALTQEAYATCSYFRALLGTQWGRWAHMSVSLTWLVYAVGLLLLGISRGHRPLRYASLGLLGFTAAKVFIIDLAFVDGSSRIFSLGGLGVALIFISWLYGRYGSSPAAG